VDISAPARPARPPPVSPLKVGWEREISMASLMFQTGIWVVSATLAQQMSYIPIGTNSGVGWGKFDIAGHDHLSTAPPLQGQAGREPPKTTVLTSQALIAASGMTTEACSGREVCHRISVTNRRCGAQRTVGVSAR